MRTFPRLATALLAAGALTVTLTACEDTGGDRAAGNLSSLSGQDQPADSGADGLSLDGMVDDLRQGVDDFVDGLGSAPAADSEQGAVGEAAGEPLVAEARGVLDGLEVKGRAPKTGYEREQFGPAWKDVDHNGCDTRNDILNRDLDNVVKDGSCTVMSGTLDDPYTGQIIDFTRGQKTSSAVQVEHVTALSDAWQKGAQQLTEEQRVELANDPENLIAVDGPANMQKGDGDAATWLPANKAYRCTYVAKQVHVKAKYNLWVTAAERDAISDVLATCGA
jgi:hypothetical protein